MIKIIGYVCIASYIKPETFNSTLSQLMLQRKAGQAIPLIYLKFVALREQ